MLFGLPLARLLTRRSVASAWNGMIKGEGVNAVPQAVVVRAGARVEVPIQAVNPRPTRIMQYSFFKNLGYEPFSFAANQHNELEALKARVLKQTPVVDPIEMNNFRVFVMMHIEELLPGFRKQKSIGIDAYLKNSNASPSVKSIIRKAWDGLHEAGFNCQQTLSREKLHRWTTRQGFVKTENNLYRSPGSELEKAPRLIQGADPRFIAVVGPEVAAWQQEVKRISNKNHLFWFTSGAYADELADYITAPANDEIFENDVSAFDTSIGVELCVLELWLAKWMGASPAVLDLMAANIRTHGYTSKGIKYSVDGTRKSGDPYTSLFNSLINAFMHIYCIWQQTGRISMSDVRMLVQGDDNLLRHRSDITPDWTTLLRLGFKCENIYRQSLFDAEFCSSRLFKTVKGWAFGPKPGRVLNKLCSFVLPPKHIHPLCIARGVAIGMLQYAYVPLVKQASQLLLKLAEGYKPYFLPQEHWKMYYKNCEPNTIECMYTMDRVYGLGTYELRKCESSLMAMTVGRDYPCVLFQLLFDKDTAAAKHIFVND